jgi:sarcosine oxidase
MTYDVAIVGLGAMGSAAAWHLARRGVRVVGLDRFTPPHGLGSSHGHTRIIREAYFEDPLYVPLVQRAGALWEELAEALASPIVVRTGGLTLGMPESALVAGALASARAHALPAETWSAAEIRARVPALAPSDGMIGVWEPRAGLLRPERAVRGMLEQAARHGAELVFDTAVTGWTVEGGGVRVATTALDYRAARVILAAGAWMAHLLPGVTLPLQVERAVQFWFRPTAPGICTPGRLPVFIADTGDRVLYGVPDVGHGVKLAVHHGGGVTAADAVHRTVEAREREEIRGLAERWVPGAAGTPTEAVVCLYTNTPDGHFVIDRHPSTDRAIVASACSGHGFKFAAAIGELLADLATGTPPAFDLAPFGAGRFANRVQHAPCSMQDAD